MANSASIEVFGPADDLLRALAALPQVQGSAINTVGSTVYNLGDFSATVGVRYEEDPSTLVVVDSFEDPDAAALRLLELIGNLPYAMEVRAADDDELLASRPARPAA